MADWFAEPAPNGETLEELLTRVNRALQHIQNGTHEAVAIVAHAVVNGAIRAVLTGGDPASYRQQYLEIVELQA